MPLPGPKPMHYCDICEQPKRDEDMTANADLTYAICFDCRAEEEFERNLGKAHLVIVAWRVTRQCGGPEEGGWWFDTGDVVASVEVVTQLAADHICIGFEIEYPRTRKRYNVHGGEDYNVLILNREDQYDLEEYFDERLDLIQHFPKVYPHYE